MHPEISRTGPLDSPAKSSSNLQCPKPEDGSGKGPSQGSFHCTPEHCLVNWFPFILLEKPCFNWLQNVSFKEPCFMVSPCTPEALGVIQNKRAPGGNQVSRVCRFSKVPPKMDLCCLFCFFLLWKPFHQEQHTQFTRDRQNEAWAAVLASKLGLRHEFPLKTSQKRHKDMGTCFPLTTSSTSHKKLP